MQELTFDSVIMYDGFLWTKSNGDGRYSEQGKSGI